MEILLVGNKNDLEEDRVVSYEEGEKMALENQLTFIEINAFDYGKVEAAFKKVAESILKKVESGKLPLNQVSICRPRASASRQVISQPRKTSSRTKRSKRRKGAADTSSHIYYFILFKLSVFEMPEELSLWSEVSVEAWRSLIGTIF